MTDREEVLLLRNLDERWMDMVRAAAPLLTAAKDCPALEKDREAVLAALRGIRAERVAVIAFMETERDLGTGNEASGAMQ